MQQIDLPAFFLGVSEELQKQANLPDAAGMPINENILPNISSQAKWKYARLKDKLKLSDGNLVYSFGLPEEFPSEDTRISRLEDDNILDFDKDALSSGTAQIHRASPDNIYLTLADGAQNPTFMLQHEGGKQWRYSPAKKFLAKLRALADAKAKVETPSGSEAALPEESPVSEDTTLIDPQALLKGAQDFLKTAWDASGMMDATEAAHVALKGIEGLKGLGEGMIQWHANNPITSMAQGYFGAKAIGALRDKFNPSRAIKRIIDPKERTSRELMPLVSAGIPTIAAGAIAR